MKSAVVVPEVPRIGVAMLGTHLFVVGAAAGTPGIAHLAALLTPCVTRLVVILPHLFVFGIAVCVVARIASGARAHWVLDGKFIADSDTQFAHVCTSSGCMDDYLMII